MQLFKAFSCFLALWFAGATYVPFTEQFPKIYHLQIVSSRDAGLNSKLVSGADFNGLAFANNPSSPPLNITRQSSSGQLYPVAGELGPPAWFAASTEYGVTILPNGSTGVSPIICQPLALNQNLNCAGGKFWTGSSSNSSSTRVIFFNSTKPTSTSVNPGPYQQIALRAISPGSIPPLKLQYSLFVQAPKEEINGARAIYFDTGDPTFLSSNPRYGYGFFYKFANNTYGPGKVLTNNNDGALAAMTSGNTITEFKTSQTKGFGFFNCAIAKSNGSFTCSAPGKKQFFGPNNATIIEGDTRLRYGQPNITGYLPISLSALEWWS